MIKKTIILSAFLVWSVVCLAQSVEQFNQTRLQRNKVGMLVLGSWAVGNLVASPILASRSSGATKYFHQMNGYWNVVNLALAGFGYLGVKSAMGASPEWTEVLDEQLKIEKLLLFNAALDVGYMVGGLYLKERAKNVTNKPERLTGFGNSLLLQGGFLLAFDAIFYLVMHQNHVEMMEWLQRINISPQGVGLHIRF